MEKKTREKRWFRIFQTKDGIVDQVKQQIRLFEKNLATKLLIDGVSPPSWLLASDHRYRTELNAEDLISEFLLSRPQFKIPFSSSNCPVFEEPVIEDTNLELPNGFSTEGCGQNDDLDAGGGNSALIVNPVADAGLASAGISALDEDTSIFSPQDKRETDSELASSLASFHRSRSRQKALEIRSSAKVSNRQFDDVNNQSGYAGGVEESAIEKLNLAIPLETNIVIPAVEAAGISALDEDPNIFSPQDQRETKVGDGNDELPATLASFRRSRSRQKAIELRSSAKVPKCQFDEENSQSGYAGGVKESAIEKLNLAIPLENNIVIPAVEAADIGGLWSKNSDNVYSSVIRENDAMPAHSTAQSTEQSNRKNKLLESVSDFQISSQSRETTESKKGDKNNQVIGKSAGNTRISRSMKSIIVLEDDTMLAHSTAKSSEQSNRKNQLLEVVSDFRISSQNCETTEPKGGDKNSNVKVKSVGSKRMRRSRSSTQQNRPLSELAVVNSSFDNRNPRQEAEIVGVEEENSDSITRSKSSYQSARSSPVEKQLELSAIVGIEHLAIQQPEEGCMSLVSATIESELMAGKTGINNSVRTTPLLATPNGSCLEGTELPAERSLMIQQREEPCVANSTDCSVKEDVVDECVGRYTRREDDIVDECVGGYLRTEPTSTTEVRSKLNNRRVTRSVSAASHKALEIQSSNMYESIVRDMSPIIDMAEQPSTSTNRSANLGGKETEVDPDISTPVEPRKPNYDNPEVCSFNRASSLRSRDKTSGRLAENNPSFILESATLQAKGVSDNCPENHSLLLNEKDDIGVEEEPQTDFPEALVEYSGSAILALYGTAASPEPEEDKSHAEKAIVTQERKQSDKNTEEKSSLTGMEESRRETLRIEDCDLSNASDFFQLDLCHNHDESRRSLAQETEDLVISGGSSAEIRSSYCDPSVDCLEPNHGQSASKPVAKRTSCSPAEDLLTRSKRRRIDLTTVPDRSPEIKENFVYPYEKDFVSRDFLQKGHIPEDVVHQTEEHNTQEDPDSLSALMYQEFDFALEERKTSNGIQSSIVHGREWSDSVTNRIEETLESLDFSLDSPHTQSLFFSELEGFVLQSDDDEQLCRVDKFSFDDIDRDRVLEQICKSASIKTPLTSSSTPHTLHKVSDLYQSVHTGLLENKHMISDEFASAFQERAHSDSFQTSTIGQDWDIKKPCLSPVRKVWDRVISKSGSSERRVSSNPELPCINEESENIEEIADTIQIEINETIASSVKRQPLGGIDENIPLSGAEPYTDRFSIDSVNTEFSFKNRSEKGNNMMRRYNNKENESLSCAGNMGSLQNRISKQKLSTRTSTRSGVSSLTVTEQKRSNIVSNITSFIPLVQKKQAAAVPTGKRDVKVKALEAAEAAKRLAQKKENERKIKKEAMKLERVRQEQENTKLLEQQKQQKEEERKKKEAKLVEKKRQREEEDRKEKGKKRQRVEESRKQQRENEQKLQAAKEEKVKVNAQKLQAAKEEKEKLRSSVVASLDNPTRTESFVSASSQEPSYDISPYKCSDNEEEEEDDDRPNTKFIPSWATKNVILKDILLQDKASSRTVFHRKSFCRISEVLLP